MKYVLISILSYTLNAQYLGLEEHLCHTHTTWIYVHLQHNNDNKDFMDTQLKAVVNILIYVYITAWAYQ